MESSKLSSQVTDTTNKDGLLVDISESAILKYDTNTNTKHNPSVLATLDGPVLDYIHPTANGRLYEESLCDKIKASEHVVEMEKSNNFLGEPDHPDNRFAVRYSEVSHAIRNFRKEVGKGAYYATFDILDTPNGRVLKTLLDYGTKLGVSSRGFGRSKVRKDGEIIVDPDNYKFSTFDIVVEPSNAINRLVTTNESVEDITPVPSKLLDEVNESLSNKDIDKLKSLKPVLTFLVESSTPGYDKLLTDVSNTISNSESNTNTPEVQTDDLVDAYSTISSLEEDISSKDSIIDNSNATIDKLNEKINSLSNLVENYESTNSDLSAKIIELSSKLEDSKLEVSRSNTKIEDLSEVSDKYHTLVDEYNSTVDDYNNLLDKYKECKSLLKSKSSEISELHESYSTKVNSLNDKIKCMNDELCTYVDELDESHDKYFSTRCSQLGINESLARSKFINESITSYSLDEIDEVLREIYKSSGNNATLSESLESSPIKVLGNTITSKSPKVLMKEYSNDNNDGSKSDTYLEGLKSSISSVRNNLA